MVTIHNHGPLIVSTNFWETEYATVGKFYVSINGGAFRLLVPPSQEPAIAEMTTAKVVVLSRGPWPAQHRDDAVEILFDDRTENPFALHLTVESFDHLPLDSDAGREWLFTAWTAPRRGRPHKALERPCWYRRVERIPCLKPWKEPQ